MKYIALDIGSSYIKSAIMNLAGYSIERKYRYQVPGANRGIDSLRFEIDAESIFAIVKKVVDEYISIFQSEIKGMMISTQMHGFLFAYSDGRPATPYISWQDNRCLQPHPEKEGSYLDYLSSWISREEMDTAGIYLKPGLGFCNAYTIVKEKQFEVKKGMLFCTLGSYLILRLTGEFACHMTNAAPTGLADIVNGRWNERFIHKVGFDQFVFPEIKNEYEICGYYKSGLDRIAVYPDLGDQQVAVLGSMMEPVTDINVNIATAAQLACICPEFKQGRYEIRPYLEGAYLNTITRIPGGRSFDVLLNFIEDVANVLLDSKPVRNMLWERIYTHVTQSPPSDLVVETGFFKDMLGAEEGAIKNITDNNLTIANLFSGAYDNIVQVYDKYIDWLIPDRKRINRLVFTGGAAWKDKILTDRIAAKTGIRALLSPLPEEVFTGHFRLALIHDKVCERLAQTKDILMADELSNKIKVKLPLC